MILVTILTILLMIAVIVAAFTLGLGTTVFIIIFGDIIVGLVILRILIKKLTTPKTNKKNWVQIHGLFSFREIYKTFYEKYCEFLEVYIMKKRGTLGLLLDFVLTILTGGLWLVWILIRYLRNS